ncbi:MAG TPA: MiaB/RimO family radical SAM methylthiotransferase [Caldisericia bacterium]|nr:MiaB/RimO family radical SAM methylthiotransferase [Caldisericia bacterium]HPF49521.1 MiaB/RimO family radical SAM methylthiotransferase [Caldisericia bacterium]HPI84185.1 MiaB/RimO family radical SAM methylthiotransferase [Caldisericia bacterium]HPQ93520.1 MiaB/RimO family radical SAM methylthiotransferase [Caldisericia bacterium]HRV75474.1 MiaB/RimO family radical SAM methylthiotransferase [Caldisericia bacterium]
MKFAVIGFGCKVNQYQAEVIRESLLSFGFLETYPEDADIVVINGCLVTHTAGAEALRAANKYSKNAKVIATGCAGASKEFEDFIQVEPDKLDTLPQILGIEGKTTPTIQGFKNHTRAMVAIQYGCDNFCSYCIVPYLRGKPRNRDFDSIIRECNTLAESGYPEIVLCGTEIGHFDNLSQLLSELSNIDKLKRIRISSINPRHLTPSLTTEILGIRKVAPHLHLPLQSGSDKVLRLMNRGYDTDHFRKIVKAARAVDPHVGITTDIIVGFPGETQENHEETLIFMREIGFYKCHVFPYSKREGTEAADMESTLDDSTVKNRAKQTRDLASDLATQALCDNIDLRAEVLCETDSRGFTGSYLRVRVKDGAPPGELVLCRLKKTTDSILIGERE